MVGLLNTLKKNWRGLLDEVQAAPESLRALTQPAAAQQFDAALRKGGTIDKEKAVQMAMDVLQTTPMGVMGKIVYHGSPHKFDKFDMSKIGTGEGAQAYGHGLYLAESPEVAKSYQSALSADRGFSFGGKTGLTRAEVQDMVNAKYGAGYLDGVIRPSGVADSFIDDMVTGTGRAQGAYPRQYKPGSQRAKVYDELRGKIVHADPGAFYKVDIPDEAIPRMLDWDKPLSQQEPEVQAALKAAGVADVDNWLQTGLRGSEAYKRAKSGAPAKLPLRQVDNEIFATQRLRAAGIPGIRYLDGGSRAAGEGTSNFVLFDDQLPRIIERNGIPTGLNPWAPGEWRGLLEP